MLAGLIVAAATVVLGVVAIRQGLRPSPAPAPPPAQRPGVLTRPAPTAPAGRAGAAGRAGTAGLSGAATAAGPDGIEARWVMQENVRPGTIAWRIQDYRGGIAGFADRSYAQQGQQVALYVSTAAARFRAEAFRMGYYQGTGGRLVWRSPEAAGRVQPACRVTPRINMVACDSWAPGLRFTITPAFPPGDYLIKLVGSGGQQSYIPLTIWDPASTAAYVIKNGVFSWQARNSYGGYDFFQGIGRCPARTYPLCSRARVVSFDRPYAAGQGAGNFLTLEYPLVWFAEEHGLDVSYATDLTIEQHPGYLDRHRALLSLGDDEAWSLGERRAAMAARGSGVNIAFFGASAILRHVRMGASPLGADRQEIDYRDPRADPLHGRASPLLVTGDTWGSPPTNWPQSDLVGEAYAGSLRPGQSAALAVTDASAWVFTGTGVQNGTVLPGVVAAAVDHYDAAMTHPGHVQVLAHSPIPPGTGLGGRGAFYSDMTYYTDPGSGAGVLDTGTGNWIPALRNDTAGCGGQATDCAASILQQITGNILLVFGQGPAGHVQPTAARAGQATGR